MDWHGEEAELHLTRISKYLTFRAIAGAIHMLGGLAVLSTQYNDQLHIDHSDFRRSARPDFAMSNFR
jgi:hypothetical protein